MHIEAVYRLCALHIIYGYTYVIPYTTTIHKYMCLCIHSFYYYYYYRFIDFYKCMCLLLIIE